MPEEVKQNGQVEEVQQEQPQGEEQQPEVMSTTEQPEQEVPREGELPDGVKERTREQFDKLKAEKAELKKQLDEYKKLPSVLDILGNPSDGVSEEIKDKYRQPAPQMQMPQYPYYPQPQAQPEPSLVDEQGYVNADVLTKELEVASQKTD